MIPTENENPNGLHQRYIVTKANGEPTGDAVYFVLRIDSGGDDPYHIEACRAAALAYCDQVQSGHTPHLAQIGIELRQLVEELGADR